MKPKGSVHIVFAILFICYAVITIKDFYQSKPPDHRNRQNNRQILLEVELPQLMDQLVHNLPRPDRQRQFDRQGGAVSFTHYYHNPNEHIVQIVQQNIQNNQWVLVRQDADETLYCKEDIALILQTAKIEESIAYMDLTLSWQARHSECR